MGHTPVHFTDVDSRAYIVSKDTEPTRPSATSTAYGPGPSPPHANGDLFDWLCALEKPGWENGFSLTGAPFIQDMEVTFYPGEERVQITHTAERLAPENSLSIKISIQGQVPYMPASAIAHTAPSKELYQYSDPAVTSIRSRDYSLAFSVIIQTFSYCIRHSIAHQACKRVPRRHRVQAQGRTRQLTVRVFALYSDEERALGFAMTNQMGPVERDSDPTPVNPCYDSSSMPSGDRCRIYLQVLTWVPWSWTE